MPRRIFHVLIALALAVAAPALAAQNERVRVFMKPTEATTDGGFVDEATKRMVDSREDFLGQLRKDKNVTLIDSAESADIVLELLSSELEEFGIVSSTVRRGVITGQVTGTTTDVPKRPTIRVQLTAGPYSNELIGAWASWRGASMDAVIQIKKWVKDNKATLLARRAQK
jgi:hypothetical protein